MKQIFFAMGICFLGITIASCTDITSTQNSSSQPDLREITNDSQNTLNEGEVSNTKPANKTPYVVLVNGYQDCCASSMEDLKKQLSNIGAEIRQVPWDGFDDNGKEKYKVGLSLSNDSYFLSEAADFINNQLPFERPLILIGHSYGGDSLLKLVPRIKRRVLFLGVLDPVGEFGKRANIPKYVPANVDYFYNRWQTNRIETDERVQGLNIVPFDGANTSGELKCEATTCDQKVQNSVKNLDGSDIRDNCGSLEITCPGYNLTPKFLGGSNGTKARRMTHEYLPVDSYVQKEIFEQIQSLLASYNSNSNVTDSETSNNVESSNSNVTDSETSNSSSTLTRIVQANDGYANLRSLPSTEVEILEKIPNGSSVTIIDEQINSSQQLWYKVVVNEKTGWIYSRLLIGTIDPKPGYVSNPLATPPKTVNDQVNQESQTPPLCRNGKPAEWFEGRGRFSCLGQDRDNNP